MTTTQRQDAIDLLLTQHQAIKRLFGEIPNAGGTQKRELFETLVRLLAVHEAAEEELVHPLARREIRNGESVVEARLQEEQKAKHALAELFEMGVDDPRFDSLLARLGGEVLEHAENEEHEEFPHLREAVPPDRLERLADSVRTAERMAPTRPHPKMPASPMANMLLGPPVAVFDRARDAIRDMNQRGDRSG